MPLYYNQKLSKPWPVSADSPFPLHWAIWHSASATDSSANQRPSLHISHCRVCIYRHRLLKLWVFHSFQVHFSWHPQARDPQVCGLESPPPLTSSTQIWQSKIIYEHQISMTSLKKNLSHPWHFPMCSHLC